MKIKILKDSGKPVILVFLGYAFTPSCVEFLSAKNYDLVVIYDYRDLSLEPEFARSLKGRETYLIAWSMGVWAANLTLGAFEFKKAVAINGTPLGIDDKFGISRADFQKSIDEFDFEKFKKLCFLNLRTRANFAFSDDPKAELKSIFNADFSAPNRIKWDRAIISKKDLIFPPKACDAYFSCEKIHIAAPHFAFFNFSDFGEIIEI